MGAILANGKQLAPPSKFDESYRMSEIGKHEIYSIKSPSLVYWI